MPVSALPARIDRSTANDILFDSSHLLRPLAEIQAMLDAARHLRPAQRRAILSAARRTWAAPADEPAWRRI